MLLESKELLNSLDIQLKQLRSKWVRQPGLALIWIGDDSQTAKFIKAKQKKAKELDCNFSLHHFPNISERQLSAVIASLNDNKKVDGIVLQLPLPSNLDREKIIRYIDPQKDVDGLNSQFPPPTPIGIIKLLEANNVNISNHQTAIIGDGRLVGRPLAELFKKKKWPFVQVKTNLSKEAYVVLKADIVIAATGKPGLITADYIKEGAIVVDGSGVDVDRLTVEPKASIVTPKSGAIGPLTVGYLFKNILKNLPVKK